MKALLGRPVNDLANTECFKHAHDEAEMTQDLAAVAVLLAHGYLLPG